MAVTKEQEAEILRLLYRCKNIRASPDAEFGKWLGCVATKVATIIFVTSWRVNRQKPVEAFMRLRTLSGEQAQVDWAHFGNSLWCCRGHGIFFCAFIQAIRRHIFWMDTLRYSSFSVVSPWKFCTTIRRVPCGASWRYCSFQSDLA